MKNIFSDSRNDLELASVRVVADYGASFSLRLPGRSCVPTQTKPRAKITPKKSQNITVYGTHFLKDLEKNLRVFKSRLDVAKAFG